MHVYFPKAVALSSQAKAGIESVGQAVCNRLTSCPKCSAFQIKQLLSHHNHRTVQASVERSGTCGQGIYLSSTLAI